MIANRLDYAYNLTILKTVQHRSKQRKRVNCKFDSEKDCCCCLSQTPEVIDVFQTDHVTWSERSTIGKSVTHQIQSKPKENAAAIWRITDRPISDWIAGCMICFTARPPSIITSRCRVGSYRLSIIDQRRRRLDFITRTIRER